MDAGTDAAYSGKHINDNPAHLSLPIMPVGVFFAFAAYAAYAFCDAIIKAIGQDISPYQVIAFTTIFSAIPVLVTKPKDEPLRDVLKTAHPWKLSIRALLGVCSTILIIYAFTTIPLAQVYALVFMTPLAVTVLSVIVLKEQVSAKGWFFVALGFAGVLLVVRPGFRELELGHLTAMACVLFASSAAILLRQVSQTEKRTTIVGYAILFSLGINLILMIPFFVWPTPLQWLGLAAIGLIAGNGHILMIKAASNAPANLIAPAQYSQIFWAIILGAAFFDEFPDTLTYAGLGIVVLAGVANVTPVRARTWFGANLIPLRRRRRKGGTATEVSTVPLTADQISRQAASE